MSKMRLMKSVLPLLVLTGLAGCASYDDQDRFVLGEATARNISEQSIRDVTVPNSEAAQSASGVRAANAVRALNEGKRKELRSSGTGASGGGGGETL